jgi:ATP-dependent Clp protease adaptor protein ClpS
MKEGGRSRWGGRPFFAPEWDGAGRDGPRPSQPCVGHMATLSPLAAEGHLAIFMALSMAMDRRIISSEDDDQGVKEGTGIGVATKTRTKTKTPSPYKVLMLNDDYTPMEFVVLVLQSFFKMGIEDATRVMLHVHQRGVGVCGIFPYEVAETKVSQVIDFARANQHPLQCTLEKA